MAQADIISVHAFPHGVKIDTWWEWALILIVAVSGAAGLIAILWGGLLALRRWFKARSSVPPLPHSVSNRIQELMNTSSVIAGVSHRSRQEPASFGVYLGTFSDPLTQDEVKLLSQWDAIILDLSQRGVVEASKSMRENSETRLQIIGRVDLRVFLDPTSWNHEVRMLQMIEKVGGVIQRAGSLSEKDTGVTGLLLAGWEALPHPDLLSTIVDLIAAFGFSAYLEVGPPDFLEVSPQPNLQSFAGVVVRNGTIMRETGEQRDYFRLEKMRSTTKAFVAQACLRPFTVMMWETVADGVSLSHAVKRRSYMWCNYHGALVWIGSASSLTYARQNTFNAEPLSGFQWLKEKKVMKIHETFRSTRVLASSPSLDPVALQTIESYIPAIGPFRNAMYRDIMLDSSSNASTLKDQGPHTDSISGGHDGRNALDWVSYMEKSKASPLHWSPKGCCFPVGLDITQTDCEKVLQSQRKLRDLRLLDRISPALAKDLSVLFQKFADSISLEQQPHMRQTISELAELLRRLSDNADGCDTFEIYIGLDSGFHTPNGAQMWSVSERDPTTGTPVIYISKAAHDVPSVILHTYLSSRNFQRYHCFLAEHEFHRIRADLDDLQKLPPRLEHDLSILSPTDLLLFLQQLHFTHVVEESPLLSNLRTACEEQLLDVPTWKKLKEQSNEAYIRGVVSSEALVRSRLSWYRQYNYLRLEDATAHQMFKEIDAFFSQILLRRRYSDLESLTAVLEAAVESGPLDPYADFLLWAVFCAARKAAFEEIYLEVSDRNPLFNEYSDQSAAFAELFALGSRCESYFDISPSIFGQLLSEKHRAYYNREENKPPMWIENAPAFASAYAAAETDIDPAQKPSVLPGYQRLTFLSVFAIPALCDIILLTTTGRGLYLSAKMTLGQQQHATIALMISLLLSGAIGTWISIGGTYYLISMAFSAANMFILTRLLGCLAIALLIGLVGFIAIACKDTVGQGAVFLFYLVGLTTYLTVLAALSSYQFPGTSFLNGRRTIICLIPTLFISPILTTWVHGYDAIIYLCIIYAFVTLLLVGLARTASKWVTWYNNIKVIDDNDMKAWFYRTQGEAEKKALEGLRDPAILIKFRNRLYAAVMAERNRHFWQKSTTDPLVRELARCWDSTIFLLDWYCRLSDVRRPIPYSSTWFLEVQVARESLLQNQKGIRLHNSFIHWRNAGDEIACGVLYFCVALADRWLVLFYGGPLTGLGVVLNQTFKVSVGFSLAYYLIGAVLLDYKAQLLHQNAQKSIPLSIESTKHIHNATLRDAGFKLRLYWFTLARFLGVHVWTLALCSALLWILDGSRPGLIMFLSYVGAYSGLLYYQYNKIFSGPHTLGPLLTAVFVGLIVGITLKELQPSFAYNDVIALASATWTAALLSIHTANLRMPKNFSAVGAMNPIRSRFRKLFKASDPESAKLDILESTVQIPGRSNRHFHAYSGAGVTHEWSQSELEAFYQSLRLLPQEDHFQITPSDHPGVEVKALLNSTNEQPASSLASSAFPLISRYTQRIISKWENGSITIDLVSMRSVVRPEADIRAISCYADGRLYLLVASDSNSGSGTVNISSNCQVIAETLIHACAESMFGLNHDQASIAESLLLRGEFDSSDQVSESLKRAKPFHFSKLDLDNLASAARRELLRHLCFGVRCDTSWESLPLDVRSACLSRVLGEKHVLPDTVLFWIASNVPAEEGCSLSSKIARYDLGAVLAAKKYNYFRNQGPIRLAEEAYQEGSTDFRHIQGRSSWASAKSAIKSIPIWIRSEIEYLYHAMGMCVKFIWIASVADPEYQRELDCVLSNKPALIAKPTNFVLNGLWIYTRAFQSVTIPLFLFYGRKAVKELSETIKGDSITLKSNRILIKALDKPQTAFIRPSESGFKLCYYEGIHKEEPGSGLKAISRYSQDMRLYVRKEYLKGEVQNEFIYDYHNVRQTRRLSKVPNNENVPMSRTCIRGKDEGSVIYYNFKGHAESGSYLINGNLLRFRYHYRKNARYSDELLRAEFVLPHITCTVSWCVPPVRHPEKMTRWIPHSQVSEATFVQGSDVYESTWLYDHKFHPIIRTKLNGELVDTPDMIRYDWLGVLKKPTSTSYLQENPIMSFTSVQVGWISRLFGRTTKRLPASTSQARSQLWKAWKERTDLDGVVMRWLDEQLLRTESLLKLYWRRRDMGNLHAAEQYLALHADSVMASAELTMDISGWTPLAIRLSDLFSFGQGGDAVVYTRTKELQADTDDKLHVLAVDTGTWPNEGGGVSACRRDLINNLRTIRWHMVVESANDFGLPKHQTEQNVESLKVIPLWGLDFLHPQHGMFSNKLDSEVDFKIKPSTEVDIRNNFIPTLSALVTGARAIDMSEADVLRATRALVNLNTYFQDSRHWKEIWTSDIVKDAWRHLWLADNIPNAKPPSEWFNTERPTLGHLDTALDLWFRYLFIFSIPIPDQVPAVFQASHHSVSAAYGIVCKVKRNCTLQIWDHAISWRETNLYLSSALCTLPPFIRNSLLGLMKMTSTLILYHADQVLPCADFFNPGWEVEIGTAHGQLEHRNVFRRKVDPVVNGITDMQKFAPVTEIKSKKPTVTMLSHVWFAKDIKTALLAADIISHEWGFKDYRLDIYGALNKAPVYSSECQEIIACKGLGESVTLKGTADPAKVLAETWVFLNSSVSEGLPLALGEAALTGAPVVCTDVGASLRVLTDPEDNERYSEVVAPNDPYALARAQINLLAMLGEWSAYAEDDPGCPPPVLPVKPTPADVEKITKRMYDKAAQRRKLGMMARGIVQKSFSGERYLREHEQMLWIGKAAYQMLDLPARPTYGGLVGSQAQQANKPQHPSQLEKIAHPRPAFLRSTATSFSSIYYDEPATPNVRRSAYGLRTPSIHLGGSDSGSEQEVGVLHKSRPNSYSIDRRPGPVPLAGTLMAPGGRHSAMSSRSSRGPSGLHEVVNAEDVFGTVGRIV